MVERLAGLSAEVDLGSEFRYRDAVLGPETLVVALSQSGETADTLGAVKAARAKGAPIVGITNVVGSALSREATGVLYTHAGPEIGVASSKTFTATITACYLLALWLGRRRGVLLVEDGKKHIRGLLELPRLMEQALELEPRGRRAGARSWPRYKNFLFLGPRHPVPDRARGRAQAQGALLHPRRGLPGRRDEARPHRADRRRACPWSRSPRATAPTTA